MTGRIAYYNAFPDSNNPYYWTDPFDPGSPMNPAVVAEQAANDARDAIQAANVKAIADFQAANPAAGALTWGAPIPAGTVVDGVHAFQGSPDAPPPVAPLAPTWTLPDYLQPGNANWGKFPEQHTGDDWYAAHNGGARYQTVNGVLVDNFMIAYAAVKNQVAAGLLDPLGTSINADLDAELAGAIAKAGAAVTYGATHGGWTPETNPNAAPVVIIPDPGFVAATPVPAPVSDPQAPPVISAPPLTWTPATVPTAVQAVGSSSSSILPLLIVAAIGAGLWYRFGRAA